MRILMYGVFNKNTNKRVIATTNRIEAEKILKELGTENFIICYKWKSF